MTLLERLRRASADRAGRPGAPPICIRDANVVIDLSRSGGGAEASVFFARRLRRTLGQLDNAADVSELYAHPLPVDGSGLRSPRRRFRGQRRHR